MSYSPKTWVKDEIIQAAELNAIEQGVAAAAVTADLATVATTGSYTDLSNKPTIPALAGPNTWTGTQDFTGATITGLDSNALASGQSTLPRTQVSNQGLGITSGGMRFAYFTSTKTETVNNLRLITGTGAAAATPTLVRAGVYSVDGSGNLTLLGAIASDTSIFATASTAYTRALTTPVSLQATRRYAVGIIVVSAATTPSLAGLSWANSAELAQEPRVSAALTGQTDLPASILATSLIPISVMPYVALLP